MPENENDLANKDNEIVNQEELDSLVGDKSEAGIQAIVNSSAVSYEGPKVQQ